MRFTDAELAAEFWCSSWRECAPQTEPTVKAESVRRVIILHRFAALPNYDE